MGVSIYWRITDPSFVGQQDYVQKKSLFGTKDFMSPEVFAGYIFENGEIDKVQDTFLYKNDSILKYPYFRRPWLTVRVSSIPRRLTSGPWASFSITQCLNVFLSQVCQESTSLCLRK